MPGLYSMNPAGAEGICRRLGAGVRLHIHKLHSRLGGVLIQKPLSRLLNSLPDQAPWGVNVFFQDLLKVRIHLSGARCDERRRLSSSQESRGEVTGSQGLELSDIEGW